MVQTKQSFTFSQLRVGIFVLFGLAVLAFLILNSTGDFNPFQKKMRLKARFSAADGLRDGAEVQFAGVRVGKVERVVLLPLDDTSGNTIEATMVVDSDLHGQPLNQRIRTDSTAQLQTVSLLANDKLINITPGTVNGAPVPENHVLESTTGASVNQLTAKGNDLLDQINDLAVPMNEILEKANRGEGTLGRVVNDDSLYRNLDTTIADAKATIRRMQVTFDKINRGEGTAGRLLNDRKLYDDLAKTVNQIEAITAEIRSGRGTAGKIVNDDALYNDTRAAINELRTAVSKINLVIDDVAAGKGTFGRLFQDERLYDDASATLARVNAAATRIESLIADAQSGKGTIGRLVTDESLFNNVNSTAQSINKFSDEGTRLLHDFRQNPKKFLTIKLTLF